MEDGLDKEKFLQKLVSYGESVTIYLRLDKGEKRIMIIILGDTYIAFGAMEKEIFIEMLSAFQKKYPGEKVTLLVEPTCPEKTQEEFKKYAEVVVDNNPPMPVLAVSANSQFYH